jgi:hypothetical protein
MSITKYFRRILLFVTIIPMLQVYSQPANLVLRDTTIATAVTFEASNSITAGPNFTIARAGDATFCAGNFIYFRPGIVIIQGGKLQTIVGWTADVRTSEATIPTKFSLEQNYPNPFNPSTTIRFALPKSSYVTLRIFNVLGEEVATLVNGEIPAGYHEVMWDASNQSGGVYFYRLQTSEYVETRKLLLLK